MSPRRIEDNSGRRQSNGGNQWSVLRNNVRGVWPDLWRNKSDRQNLCRNIGAQRRWIDGVTLDKFEQFAGLLLLCELCRTNGDANFGTRRIWTHKLSDVSWIGGFRDGRLDRLYGSEKFNRNHQFGQLGKIKAG